MSESEKPFTVKDRRHFTTDGSVREGSDSSAEAEPRPDERPAPAPEAPAPPESPSPSPPADSEPPPEPEAPRGPTAQESPTGAPADFGQFLLSLGAQAGMLLAGQGLPEGADPAEALGGAHSIISILEMLQTKSEGNRTPEEAQILDGLLFELRMAYVEKTRGGS